MKRNLIVAGLIVWTLVPFVTGNLVAAQDGAALTTSQPKGRVADIEAYANEIDKYVKSAQAKERIFGDIASGTDNSAAQWREFKTEDERKNAKSDDSLYQSANVWVAAGKVIGASFTFSSPSGDWAQFVMYYFRINGTLAKSSSTLNTFNGGITVLRQDYYDSKGMLLKGTTHCKDLKTQQPRPCGEFEDKPAPVYKSVRQLPFYGLLK